MRLAKDSTTLLQPAQIKKLAEQWINDMGREFESQNRNSRRTPRSRSFDNNYNDGSYNNNNNGDGNNNSDNNQMQLTASAVRRATNAAGRSVLAQVTGLLKHITDTPHRMLSAFVSSTADNDRARVKETLPALVKDIMRYFEALYLAGGEKGGPTARRLLLRAHSAKLVSFFKTSADPTLFPRVRFARCDTRSSASAGCILPIACPVAPMHAQLLRKDASSLQTIREMQRQLINARAGRDNTKANLASRMAYQQELGAAALVAIVGRGNQRFVTYTNSKPGVLELIVRATAKKNENRSAGPNRNDHHNAVVSAFVRAIMLLPPIEEQEHVEWQKQSTKMM